MLVDETLKELLQLCADMQDAFWEAAAHAQCSSLPALFQEASVQWNGFSDKIFTLLLELDHTSPDAHWKANPGRHWMNAAEASSMDDRVICRQCLMGLEFAGDELRKAAACGEPRVRRAAIDQLSTCVEQMTAINVSASGAERRAV